MSSPSASPAAINSDPALLRLSDFDYQLPPDQIAQAPLEQRDESRLMVLDRQNRTLDHKRFRDITAYLKAGDVLVLNATRVFPARLRGHKRSGGKAELLLLRPMAAPKWQALVRGAAHVGLELVFAEGLSARLEERLANGEWVVRFSESDVRGYLERFGEMPLPPYIRRPEKKALDHTAYQTVFARAEGSIAAPTAGFHFTPELLTRLRDQGVEIIEIVLHVGWGTFRPVRSELIAEHVMLPEMYDLSADAAQRLTRARREKRRIIAVGTTAVRTLEATYSEGVWLAGSGSTNLYIYPGYAFRSVDALITNFHLPDSTPLLLANAFYAPSPAFSLRTAYEEAVRQGYRFYSYGDAMFIQ